MTGTTPMPKLTEEEIKLWKEIAWRSAGIVSFIEASENASSQFEQELHMQSTIAASNSQKEHIEQAICKIGKRQFYMIGIGLTKAN